MNQHSTEIPLRLIPVGPGQGQRPNRMSAGERKHREVEARVRRETLFAAAMEVCFAYVPLQRADVECDPQRYYALKARLEGAFADWVELAVGALEAVGE